MLNKHEQFNYAFLAAFAIVYVLYLISAILVLFLFPRPENLLISSLFMNTVRGAAPFAIGYAGGFGLIKLMEARRHG